MTLLDEVLAELRYLLTRRYAGWTLLQWLCYGLITVLLALWIGHQVTVTGPRAPEYTPPTEGDCTTAPGEICGYTQDGEPIRWT